jgi:excisionase family DNA binding protein
MDSNTRSAASPAFYTVPEAARVLRVTPATIYRAIREDAFPAVRIRNRYVVPASAVARMAAEAAESGGCVDVAQMAAQRRTAREVARATGGAPW